VTQPGARGFQVHAPTVRFEAAAAERKPRGVD